MRMLPQVRLPGHLHVSNPIDGHQCRIPCPGNSRSALDPWLRRVDFCVVLRSSWILFLALSIFLVDFSRGGSNEMRSVIVTVTKVTYLECWWAVVLFVCCRGIMQCLISFCCFLTEQVQQEHMVQRNHVWWLQVHIVLFAYAVAFWKLLG